MVDRVVEQVGGLRFGGIAELHREHLVAGNPGEVGQRGGSALQVPDVHHETGSRVVRGDDELRCHPEVGEVRERQRFQCHPGSDLGGLLREQMQLGRPMGHVPQ